MTPLQLLHSRLNRAEREYILYEWLDRCDVDPDDIRRTCGSQYPTFLHFHSDRSGNWSPKATYDSLIRFCDDRKDDPEGLSRAQHLLRQILDECNEGVDEFEPLLRSYYREVATDGPALKRVLVHHREADQNEARGFIEKLQAEINERFDRRLNPIDVIACSGPPAEANFGVGAGNIVFIGTGTPQTDDLEDFAERARHLYRFLERLYTVRGEFNATQIPFALAVETGEPVLQADLANPVVRSSGINPSLLLWVEDQLDCRFQFRRRPRNDINVRLLIIHPPCDLLHIQTGIMPGIDAVLTELSVDRASMPLDDRKTHARSWDELKERLAFHDACVLIYVEKDNAWVEFVLGQIGRQYQGAAAGRQHKPSSYNALIVGVQNPDPPPKTPIKLTAANQLLNRQKNIDVDVFPCRWGDLVHIANPTQRLSDKAQAFLRAVKES